MTSSAAFSKKRANSPAVADPQPTRMMSTFLPSMTGGRAHLDVQFGAVLDLEADCFPVGDGRRGPGRGKTGRTGQTVHPADGQYL